MSQQIAQKDFLTRALWTASAFVMCVGLVIHDNANTTVATSDIAEQAKFKKTTNDMLRSKIDGLRNDMKLSVKQAEIIRSASEILAPKYDLGPNRSPQYVEGVNEFAKLNTEKDLLGTIRYEKESEFTQTFTQLGHVINSDIDPVELAKELAFAKRQDDKAKLDKIMKEQCARTPDACTPSS